MLAAGLKILQLLCLTSCRLNVAHGPLSFCGITSDSNPYGFRNCLDGLWRQGVCVVHSLCMGFQTVPGNVPWLVTVVTDPRGVLGLCTIQVHGLWFSWLADGGGRCRGQAGRGLSRGGRSNRAHQGCGRVLRHCCLRAGGVEPPPLVVEDGGLTLPFDPSPGHQLQSVDTLPQAGVEHLLEVMDKSNIP